MRDWTFHTLTDLCTGDSNGDSGRLISTGLLGSIRWWFEVLVRGVGGSACDPSRTECKDRGHCAVCELFGCTEWARKFRFDVLDDEDNVQRKQIKAGTTFKLRFTPLRPIRDEEWALLDLTLRLIAEYGAIGGKTVYKPSDEPGRQDKANHKDYGLIKLLEHPAVIAPGPVITTSYARDWKSPRVNQGGFAWASLENLWCVSGLHLSRQDAQVSDFNRVIGRPEPKGQSKDNDSWLAGRQPRGNQDAESKKVFSFKDPARTFGFVNPPSVTYAIIKDRLETAWGNGSVASGKFLTGAEIRRKLLPRLEGN